MIYRIGRSIVNVALRQFFSVIKVTGAEPLKSGPLLIVANHPNMALDPFLINSIYHRPLWYLAKSTLFKGPIVSSFLRLAHLVPVYRRQDAAQDISKNKEVFGAASRILGNSKGVVIFPEGTSLGERKLFELKTGAARIAFQAEEEANFSLGLKIQPVGLNYEDFDEFRSSVTIRVGSPIGVGAFKGQYLRDPVEAVRELTARLEDALRNLTVELKDQKYNELVEKISKLYSALDPETDIHQRMRIVAANVEKLADNQAHRGPELIKRIDAFLRVYSGLAVGGSASSAYSFDFVFKLMIFPVVVLGVVLNFLPYRLVGVLVKWRVTHPAEGGSKKLSIGFMVFLGWYLLLSLLFAWQYSNLALGGLAFVSLLIIGHFVNHYLNAARLLAMSLIWPGGGSPLEILDMYRDGIVAELESLRVE